MSIRSSAFSFIACLFALQGAPGIVSAAPQLDANFQPDTATWGAFVGLSTSVSLPRGQPFTVGADGTLASVELYLSRDANASVAVGRKESLVRV